MTMSWVGHDTRWRSPVNTHMVVVTVPTATRAISLRRWRRKRQWGRCRLGIVSTTLRRGTSARSGASSHCVQIASHFARQLGRA